MGTLKLPSSGLVYIEANAVFTRVPGLRVTLLNAAIAAGDDNNASESKTIV